MPFKDPEMRRIYNRAHWQKRKKNAVARSDRGVARSEYKPATCPLCNRLMRECMGNCDAKAEPPKYRTRSQRISDAWKVEPMYWERLP